MTKTVLAEKERIFNFTDGVELETIAIVKENYFKISNSDQIRPFLMSIVSFSDHWMFISSNGGLTAGRKNSEFALFPYYTDDKITENFDNTGSKSIFQVEKDGIIHVWEPFSDRFEGRFEVSRNLYKNVYGNKIVFEEINHDLDLTFQYQWNSSNTFGFIKKSKLINNGSINTRVSVLDGIQNVLPYGVESYTQTNSSNLVDAYKRTELEPATGLGIFALSAIIVDKAEPSEALKANVVWSLGLDNPKYLLSSLQLNNFRKKQSIAQETDVKAERGAYFINTEISLAPNSEREWMFIANLNQNHSQIAELIHRIKTEKDLAEKVNYKIERSTQRLIELNAASDAIQVTSDSYRDSRHFSNTLFNIMRGGIFDDNYNIELWDFKNYIYKANKKVARNDENIINNLPKIFTLSKLKEIAYSSSDKNFRRLCLEYMPLKFSRRHGDPSRPWNKFSINVLNDDGTKKLDYEGNWRDIFQNWEALAYSYPEFIESMIHKFLNATTFDGYNPYRVTKDGYDWEVIEPDDPWSYIGYWGDHQIIYLLKFLEFFNDLSPGKLERFFTKDLFVYANVPYKIKSYSEILENPKDTIEFDEELDEKIRRERKEIGADGALLRDENRFIVKVNFIEKILATALAKMSNFIPEGGIWMNTQRPEWNDANNALVGNGVSMVTLYYLRRFLSFFQDVFANAETNEVEVSTELVTFFRSVVSALDTHKNILSGKINDVQRKQVLDGLGEAGSTYREQIYNNAFTGRKSTISSDELKHFVKVSLAYLEHSIDANKREDNLYHAYNLMTVESDRSVSISYLDEMLEGQVAVLSSQYLSPEQSLAVLDGMKESALFRPDQYSYLLYPFKNLKGFIERNTIPASAVENSELLQKLLADNNVQIIEKDIKGTYHFNGNFRNANAVKEGLKNLPEHYKSLVTQDEKLVLKAFENVFNHKAFTGRSGTFYGYEGLGSIYWHMVSKLQLAVLETCITAIEEDATPKTIGRLLEHYYEINEGIGVHKSPKLYGAFPTDPYSHTPAGKGAQQPGMTGQVKEDILSRFGELGVFVKDGKLTFNPCMLRIDEFLNERKIFKYVNIDKENKEIELEPNSLAFTICQIPVVYNVGNEHKVTITMMDGSTNIISGLTVDSEISSKIFKRTNEVMKLEVSIEKSLLK